MNEKYLDKLKESSENIKDNTFIDTKGQKIDKDSIDSSSSLKKNIKSGVYKASFYISFLLGIFTFFLVIFISILNGIEFYTVMYRSFFISILLFIFSYVSLIIILNFESELSDSVFFEPFTQISKTEECNDFSDMKSYLSEYKEDFLKGDDSVINKKDYKEPSLFMNNKSSIDKKLQSNFSGSFDDNGKIQSFVSIIRDMKDGYNNKINK